MNIINPILGNFTIRKVFVSIILLIIVFSLYLWLPTKSVTDYSLNDHQYSVATINCGEENVCDIEVTKKDKDGNILWQHTFGGSSYDKAGEVISTKDGGCLVVGSTSSYGAGNYDVLLLKINADGELIWQETYGGFFNDYGKKISRLTDSNGYSIEGTQQTCDTPNVSNECIDFFWKFEVDESGKLKG